MNEPNVTLIAFCANIAYTDIPKYVKVTLQQKPALHLSDFDEFKELGDCTPHILAIYGNWYVNCIDIASKLNDQDTPVECWFEVIIQKEPVY